MKAGDWYLIREERMQNYKCILWQIIKFENEGYWQCGHNSFSNDNKHTSSAGAILNGLDLDKISDKISEKRAMKIISIMKKNHESG